MNSDSLNMVSRLGKGHMPCTFFLSEPQLKTTGMPMVVILSKGLTNTVSKMLTDVSCLPCVLSECLNNHASNWINWREHTQYTQSVHHNSH